MCRRVPSACIFLLLLHCIIEKKKKTGLTHASHVFVMSGISSAVDPFHWQLQLLQSSDDRGVCLVTG